MSDGLKFKQALPALFANLPVLERRHCAYGFCKTSTHCVPNRILRCVFWCYSARTAVPAQQLAVLVMKLKFLEDIPENFENVQGRPCLFILDDLLNSVFQKNCVCDFFTKGSHNRNISVVLIIQNLFHQGRHLWTFL